MWCYREAMKVWQEYKDKMEVDCDKLQRIHALENLAYLLKECPQHTPGELPQHAPGETPQHAQGESPQHPPGETPQHALGETPQHAGPGETALLPGDESVPEALLTLKSQELMEEVSFMLSLCGML